MSSIDLKNEFKVCRHWQLPPELHYVPITITLCDIHYLRNLGIIVLYSAVNVNPEL